LSPDRRTVRNDGSRCGISDSDIYAKAAARKGEAPESEVSYSGNRRTGDYTF